MTNQHASDATPDDQGQNKASGSGSGSAHDYGGLTPDQAGTDLDAAQDVGADPPGGIVFGLPEAEDSTAGEAGHDEGT